VSATGRGPRLGGPDDFYVTPSWCVRRLLEALDEPPQGPFLEPAAGDGAIIKAVGGSDWTAVECRAVAKRDLFAAGAGVVHIDDFLTWEPPPGLVIETIITNPPFALCEEFIRRAGELFPDATAYWLVRLGFLASEKRTRLWKDIGAPNVYVLPNRPSFTPDGKTDSADYCWIEIRPEYYDDGVFRVLAPTPASERGKRQARGVLDEHGREVGP